MEDKVTLKKSSLDDALTLTGFGLFHISLVLISGVMMSTTYFEIMGVNFILPIAECDLDITAKSQYGIVSGSWFVGVILSSHMWGFLADSFGRKKIVTIAPMMSFITSILTSLSVNYWMLAVCRFFNGACIAGSATIIFAYLGEFLTNKNRNLGVMLASVIFGVGCLVVPLVAFLILNQSWRFVIPLLGIEFKPWRLMMLVCGVPSFLSGLALLFFPESPKFTFSQGKYEETLKTLTRVHKFNCNKTEFPVKELIVSADVYNASSGKGLIRVMIHNTLNILKNYSCSFWLLSFLQFGIFYVAHGMLLFFPDILHKVSQSDGSGVESQNQICEIVRSAIVEKRNAFDDSYAHQCIEHLDFSAFYYVIILEMCYFLGFLVISLLVNYIGRMSIFVIVFITTGLSGILIIVINNLVISNYLYMWLLVIGVNSNLLNTVTFDAFPTELRSMAISTTLLFGRVGGLLGVNVSSYMVEDYCEMTFGVSGGLLILCTVLTLFIPRIVKKSVN